MVASKTAILAPVVAFALSGVVSIVLIIFYYQFSVTMEHKAGQLEDKLNRLEKSIIEWQTKPLSNDAKNNIRGLVDEELDRCETVAPMARNLKVVRSLEAQDNKTMEKYLKVGRPMAHLTAKSGHYVHPHGEAVVSYWKHNDAGTTYLCSGVRFHKGYFEVKRTGPYYVYSQLKYRYKPNGRTVLHRHITKLQHGNRTNKILENSHLLGEEEKGNHGHEWRIKTSHQSRYLHLNRGERLYVTSQVGPETEFVKDLDSDTFFGLFLLS